MATATARSHRTRAIRTRKNRRQEAGPALLRDDAGYYVRSVAAIDALLDVRKYVTAWPLIPPEELHASSIQHPAHPDYRWLLNTRRVPTRDDDSMALAASASDVAAEHATAASCHEPQLPPCAGVAEPDPLRCV